MELNRIRSKELQAKVMSADEAALIIKDGMTIGTSGFTPSGYPKSIPLAVAARVEAGEKIKVDLLTGASVGVELDETWGSLGMINRRMPYQTSTSVRNSLNTPEGIKYQDQHLSLSTQNTRYGFYGDIDVAIVEACAITEDGHIVPTTSLGNAPTFVKMAKKVLVEINTTQPAEFEGIHDIYIPLDPPNRQAIPINKTTDRIGTTYIECGVDKIAGIVFSDIPDKAPKLAPIDDNSKAIATNIVNFLTKEVELGRLPKDMLPLQSGVGSVANAVLAGLENSPFENLEFYSEVIQDGAISLIDSGKFAICSGTSITASEEVADKIKNNLDFYKKHIILRPQEISNHPEISRRLGVIAMNTAIEADIYGNVNSTHIMGTRMMNGIGGSGDYARSAYLSIFITASTAKGGAISSIVPMCSHTDHTEHDVCIIVSEYGLADLRNKSPRERAVEMIKISHPDYRPMLQDYFDRALEENPAGKCHTPHILTEALSWHDRFNKTGSMKLEK